jgi:Spy/CpxP family protein refolding chaperone
MRSQIKNEIDAVLTPEQKQKLEAMINEFMKKRNLAHDKMPGDPSRQMDKGDKK